jgi:hypothetical protein
MRGLILVAALALPGCEKGQAESGLLIAACLTAVIFIIKK